MKTIILIAILVVLASITDASWYFKKKKDKKIEEKKNKHKEKADQIQRDLIELSAEARDDELELIEDDEKDKRKQKLSKKLEKERKKAEEADIEMAQNIGKSNRRIAEKMEKERGLVSQDKQADFTAYQDWAKSTLDTVQDTGTGHASIAPWYRESRAHRSDLDFSYYWSLVDQHAGLRSFYNHLFARFTDFLRDAVQVEKVRKRYEHGSYGHRRSTDSFPAYLALHFAQSGVLREAASDDRLLLFAPFLLELCRKGGEGAEGAVGEFGDFFGGTLPEAMPDGAPPPTQALRLFARILRKLAKSTTEKKNRTFNFDVNSLAGFFDLERSKYGHLDWAFLSSKVAPANVLRKKGESADKQTGKPSPVFTSIQEIIKSMHDERSFEVERFMDAFVKYMSPKVKATANSEGGIARKVNFAWWAINSLHVHGYSPISLMKYSGFDV